MRSKVDGPTLYQGGVPNIGEMHESIRSMEGEHLIAGAHCFLAFAELGDNPGLVDVSTEEERGRHIGTGESTWVELSTPEGVQHGLSSAGWAGTYLEYNRTQINGKLRMLFGYERVILDAESVEDFQQHDRFFVIGDVACSAFVPKLAELDSTWWSNSADAPDYKRHLGVQHNRGLLLLSELRQAGVDPVEQLSSQPTELQQLAKSRLERLEELMVKGGITPFVASVLGWDYPEWLRSPRYLAARIGAFELDAETTARKVLDTLMSQVEVDDKMKESAGEQSYIAQTAGGSSDRYVAGIVSNVVTNLLGIR